MALTQCPATVDVIANLSDAPVLDGTKTTEQFKDAFDQAGREIKSYINNTLLGQIETQFQTKLSGTNQIGTSVIQDGAVTADKIYAGAVTVNKLGSEAVETAKIKDGNVTYAKLNSNAKSTALTGTAEVGDWDGGSNECEVTVTGLAAGDNIIVSPAPSSFVKWRDCGIRCFNQDNGSIDLICDEIPDEDIDVQVLVVR